MEMIYSFSPSGINPQGDLATGPDGSFYGITSFGGSGYGTVFRVSTNGALTILAQFNSYNGWYPFAGLIAGSDGSLYGTSLNGGSTAVEASSE